jgi:hypothetical protein
MVCMSLAGEPPLGAFSEENLSPQSRLRVVVGEASLESVQGADYKVRQ